jgi:hypothetical protein
MNTLVIKSDDSIILELIVNSLVNFLTIEFIIKFNFLNEFQKFSGKIITDNILNQFIDNLPVHGSNTENRLVISFNWLNYFF